MGKKRRNDTELIPVEKSKRVIKVESMGGRRRGASIGRAELAGYIFSALLILLIVTASVTVILVRAHVSKIQKLADTVMPELWETEDGTYELSWHSLEEAGADTYYVNVGTYALGGGESEKVFFSGYVEESSCRLPDLPTDEGLVLRIDLFKDYSVFGEERTWEQASIQRFFYIQDPEIRDLDWKVGSDEGKALISFDSQGCNSCCIYVREQDGGRRLLKIVDGNSVELDLNEELWMPTPENPCTLTFVPGNRVNGMALYGGESKDLTLTWEDFAERDIHLSMDVIDGCVCHLEWDRVDSDVYEIQIQDDDTGEWITIKTVARDDECIYVTPRLKPGAERSFRVAAVLNDYVAVSEVRKCEPAVTPMYCTVWPVKNLKAYSDAAKSEVVGEVEELDAHCVVAVEDGMFGVNLNDRVCYIDSNYCMINLPEYVGDLCSYDITNSYDSIFMAHGFEIPGLTGQVIEGFENVRLGDNSFLVPLLYPTAIKLERAIENAREKGCRLKIYEAFRPHKASVYMYRKASEVQYKTLPESTYRGDEPGASLYVSEINESGVSVERRKTYWELMNDIGNSFTLSAFVSAGVSRHNLGVAMDLTLESLDTGYELLMQTDLHDLSQYSARAQNNSYAKDLSNVMMSAGFKDLYSEWWHFQDDEIKNKLSLPCVDEGVSAECWMTNSFGWRYRSADGSYAADCTISIDGKEYTFDSDGYVQN